MDNNELVMNADGMVINGFDPRQYADEHPDNVNVVDDGTALRLNLSWEDLEDALHRVYGTPPEPAADLATAAEWSYADTATTAQFVGTAADSQDLLQALRYPNIDAGFCWGDDPDTYNALGAERSMTLSDETEIIIRIGGSQEFRLKFAGYFSENIMDEVIAQYIGEDDAGIIQETGAIVFRYMGNVVAVTPDHYHTSECFTTCEDGVMVHRLTPQAVRYGISPEHLMIVWNCGDETVGTKEPLVVMDRAFDEVFQ